MTPVLWHATTALTLTLLTSLTHSLTIEPFPPDLSYRESQFSSVSVPRDPSDSAQTILPSSGDRTAAREKLQILSQNDVTLSTRESVLSDIGKNKNFFADIKATQVIKWWASLSDENKKRLVTEMPEVLGQLNGLPYSLRSEANKARLEKEIVSLKTNIRLSVGKGVTFSLKRTLKMLENIRSAAENHSGKTPRFLISYDSKNEGRSVIALGDLDSADYVSFLIPGMYFAVEQQVIDWTRTADETHRLQTMWLKRSQKMTQNFDTSPSISESPKIATVSWIGYKTPDFMTVAGLNLADNGADSLARDLTTFRSIRESKPAFLSVLAHSYGATVALMALERSSVHIDALGLVGSPGSVSQRSTDLMVSGNRVFVGEAAWDPIVDTAFHGSDPGDASYGAHKIGVSGGIDPITGQKLTGSIGHNEYFAKGSESLRNLSLVGVGLGFLVTNGEKGSDGRTLAFSQKSQSPSVRSMSVASKFAPHD